MFVARGYQVVRFDNRDVGLSSKLDGVEYALADMALTTRWRCSTRSGSSGRT